MTRHEVNRFEKVQSQLEALYNEISTLSKKSQNDALNKFKLKFVNQVLQETNQLLGATYRPFAEFELFDDNEMPTNSDVTLILAQYLNCLEKLRTDNIEQETNFPRKWYWRVEGKSSNIETSAPRKIK